MCVCACVCVCVCACACVCACVRVRACGNQRGSPRLLLGAEERLDRRPREQRLWPRTVELLVRLVRVERRNGLHEKGGLGLGLGVRLTLTLTIGPRPVELLVRLVRVERGHGLQ